MPADETRTTSATGGEKGTKLAAFHLLPVEALTAVAEHYGRGARKYADNNWRRGYEWSKSYAALQRHATAFWGGEDIDEETGSHHMAAVAFHALALLEFAERFPDYDDRYVRSDPNVFEPEVGMEVHEYPEGAIEEALSLVDFRRAMGHNGTALEDKIEDCADATGIAAEMATPDMTGPQILDPWTHGHSRGVVGDDVLPEHEPQFATTTGSWHEDTCTDAQCSGCATEGLALRAAKRAANAAAYAIPVTIIAGVDPDFDWGATTDQMNDAINRRD